MSEIKSERVDIDGETRIKIAIERDKDRIILYLAQETVESLRLHFNATIGLHRGDLEVERARESFLVRFSDGVDGVRFARTPHEAITEAAAHRWLFSEVRHIEGDTFEGVFASIASDPFKTVTFTATATPSTEPA